MFTNLKNLFSLGKLTPRFISRGIFIGLILLIPISYIKYLFSFQFEESSFIKLSEKIVFTCNILIPLIKLFLLKLITETIYLITKASKLVISNTAK